MILVQRHPLSAWLQIDDFDERHFWRLVSLPGEVLSSILLSEGPLAATEVRR